MDQSTPGPPVFHYFPELGQIHVGRFGDTVQLLAEVLGGKGALCLFVELVHGS